MQLLLFTFDVGLLLLADAPALGHGVAPQGAHVPWQLGYLSPTSDFGQGVAPDGYAAQDPSHSGLSNSMKLSNVVSGHPRWMGHGGER